MEAIVLDEKGKESWSDFLASHPQGHFMQSPEWGGLKETHGWQSTIVAVRQGGDLAAGTLILSRRLPGIGKKIFYSPRGPVWRSDCQDALEPLVAKVREVARKEKACLWRIDPYLRETTVSSSGDPFRAAGFRKVPLEWSYWNGSKYVMILETSAGPDKTFAKLSSNGRNQVRSAWKNGVEVCIGSECDFGAFMTTMTNTAQKKGIPVREQKSYENLYRIFKQKDRIELFLAKKGNEVASSGLSISYGKKSWLMYLSSDYSIKNSSRAVQWEMIRHATEKGCHFFDFQGTATSYPPKESDKGYGVYSFKKSFGAEVAILAGYYDYVFDPIIHRMFSLTEQKLLPFGEKFLLSRFNIFVLLNRFRKKD